MFSNDDSRLDDSIRVLYVEDERGVSDLASESLSRENTRLDIVTEPSASDGLRRLRNESIDCIVSDHDLAAMSGVDFLEAVREEYPDLPFILFTGTGSEAVASEAVSAGVTDYLQKGDGIEQYAVLANRIENVVEQFRAQRAAARRERRLETLVSNLPGIVYRCRNAPGWPMEHVGGECERLVGYDCAELVGSEGVRWGEEVIHPEDRERTWNVVQEAIERGEHFECTYRVVTAEGEIRWMWERGRLVDERPADRAEDGHTGAPDALEGFITDITDSKERERDLRRSQRRFDAIFEDPNLLVALLDLDGTVREINRTALEYVEADRDDVVGEAFTRTPWWTDDQHDDVERWIERAASGDYVEFEATHPVAGGETITVEGFFRPVIDGDGAVTSIVASARNVTARREHERELKRQRDRLDEFASFISHDLQGPISVARGRLELALETGDLSHVETAVDAVERVDELRTDLADTLRSGEIVATTTPIDLEDAFDAVWTAIDPPEAMSASVVEPAAIEADPDALRRLLENLVRNSIEHGGDGVAVRIGGLDDGFYYEDDGPGIAPEHRDRAFTPGFSTKGNDDGTGMGLASVRQIVHAHGWEIRIEDGETLDGARFEIRTE
ncbi:PAS domain S-box protein [Halobellus sp. GM3]|uniref:PAS domain S-box protein n=1 Tax=Halobellus sp. GM3 TaxID=3458410 RepID=UPI00403DDC3A